MLKTIEDVCQLLNGYSFKSKKYVDSGIRIIRIANVQKGFIEDNTPAFYPLETPGIENYMLKEGDLLISLTGNVGRVALLNKEMLPAALNQRVACLRIKDDSIYKKFLFHYLNSSKFENTCILESRGVAQKNMSTEWLKRQPIPNYTLQNQIKISKILDSIIEIINKKRQQLVEFDSLIKSRFVEMFENDMNYKNSWKIDYLGNLVTIVRGASPRPIQSFITEDENGINWIKIGDAKVDSMYIWATKEKITPEGAKKSRHVKEGDFLLSNSMSFGRPYILKTTGCVHDGWLVLSKYEDHFNKYFLYALLNSETVYNKFKSMVVGGVVNNLNSEMVRNLEVFVPPIDIQNEFARILKQIDKLKFENEILYSIYRFTINKQTKLLGYRGVTL